MPGRWDAMGKGEDLKKLFEGVEGGIGRKEKGK